ncbi:MAG: archease [candidate division KSB1 bacterium]|nr:archease [candidate division KSB1 bacterium]
MEATIRDSASGRKRYDQIEHTADLGIRVYGDSLKELFINAAYALFDTITDINSVKPSLAETVEIVAGDREELLVNWLSELNYLFFTEEMIFSKFDIEKLGDRYLKATARGEKLDPKRHEIFKEIKAVTYHELKIEQKKGRWEAQVIFDI